MSSTRLLSVAFVRGAGPWANAAIPLVLLVVVVVLRLAQGPTTTGANRSPI